MFCLSIIKHTLRLAPELLNLPLDHALKKQLEELFLDKVVAKLGLCISVYDIKSIKGGFIFPGDGASTYIGILPPFESIHNVGLEAVGVKMTKNGAIEVDEYSRTSVPPFGLSVMSRIE